MIAMRIFCNASQSLCVSIHLRYYAKNERVPFENVNCEVFKRVVLACTKTRWLVIFKASICTFLELFDDSLEAIYFI